MGASMFSDRFMVKLSNIGDEGHDGCRRSEGFEDLVATLCSHMVDGFRIMVNSIDATVVRTLA